MFTQLSPRACWLTPVGTLLCFWLGSCALLTEFFAFLQKRTEEVEITFELLNCCISLFLSSTVTFWGYLKPRLLSYIPVFSDRGPLPQTVSWHRGASLCLRKNNLGLSVCKKGCKFKAFVKTIWWFYWSMWAEHMEALRKKSLPYLAAWGWWEGVLQIRIPLGMWSGTHWLILLMSSSSQAGAIISYQFIALIELCEKHCRCVCERRETRKHCSFSQRWSKHKRTSRRVTGSMWTRADVQVVKQGHLFRWR